MNWVRDMSSRSRHVNMKVIWMISISCSAIKRISLKETCCGKWLLKNHKATHHNNNHHHHHIFGSLEEQRCYYIQPQWKGEIVQHRYKEVPEEFSVLYYKKFAACLRLFSAKNSSIFKLLHFSTHRGSALKFHGNWGQKSSQSTLQYLFGSASTNNFGGLQKLRRKYRMRNPKKKGKPNQLTFVSLASHR